MLRPLYTLLALCISSAVLVAAEEPPIINTDFNSKVNSLLSSSFSSSLLSKDFVQDAVDKEIRKTLHRWSAEANTTEAKEARRLLQEEQDQLFAPSPNQLSLRRHLELTEPEKWEKINAILDTLVVTIPTASISQELLGFTVSATANGTCSNIAIEDLTLDYDKGVTDDDEVQLAYKVQIVGAKLKCFLNIDWNTGVLDVQDSIKMKLILTDNSFGVAVNLVGSPPTSAQFLGCKVVVEIGDVQTTGGFSSNIINDLNSLIVGLVRSEVGLISGTICNILFDFTEDINALLGGVVDVLKPFLVYNVSDVDPLSLEKEVDADPSLNLVNFQGDMGLGNIVNVILTNLATVISADQINTIVELNLLNEDGVFVLELGEVPADFGNETHRLLQDTTVEVDGEEEERDCIAEAINGVDLPIDLRGRRLETVFNDYLNTDYVKTLPASRRGDGRELQLGETDIGFNFTLDEIINTTDIFVVNEITPISVSIVGLNNFTGETLLNVIGKYTLNSALGLPFLGLSADIFLDIDVNGINIQELVTAVVELKDLSVNASFLVGLDENVVDQWTLGTFLNTSAILDCILSALEVAGASQLDVTVDFIGTPAIDGLLSDDVNDLLNMLLEGFTCAYQDLIKEAIPGFVQQNVTTILNDFIECFIETEAAGTECPSPTDLADMADPGGLFDFRRLQGVFETDAIQDRVPGFLDFRDLLLMPDDAKALGGSGTQPYGDLISMAFDTLLGELTGADNETGLLGINSFFPEDGIALDMDLFDITIDFSDIDFLGTLLSSAELGAYNIKAGNINTLVDPLAFLTPTTKAHVLTNTFNWGPIRDRAPNASVTVFTALHGSENLALSNTVDAAARISEINLAADFQVMISTRDFILFPLRDVMNLNCWLALLQEPNQMMGDEMMDNSFEITKLIMNLANLSVEFDCLNCTSTVLPGAIKILDDAGAMAVLGNKMGPLLEEVATSDMVPPLITDMLGVGEAAARLCPHQPLFNTTPSSKQISTSETEIPIPLLSNSSIDTVVLAGILGAEVFAVVFAETHVKAARNRAANNVTQSLSDPLSGQEMLNLTGDPNLLDWYRLNETFIPMAGDALDLVRELVGNTSGGAPGINDLAGGFLEEDGSFNLSLGIAIPFQGYEIVIESIEVLGLDTFTRFDILEPIAPQTLQNSIEMENLTVAIDFSLDATNTSDPAQSYRISFDIDDLNATFYLFAAIDMDKVESLEIGQLLFIANILPCMLASAYEVSIPAMYVTMGNLSHPTVEGLMPDSSEVAAASLEAMFDEYGSLLAESISSIVDETIRPVLNEFVTSFIEDTGSCKSSSEVIIDTAPELIDFRDLLLPPEAAVVLGGSGLQPYGDIVSTVYSLILDQILSSEGEGELLGLNSFIDSFTEDLSGVPGSVTLEGELFRFFSDGPLPLQMLDWLNQTIEISAFDARIRNLNTLVSPLAVAYPTKHPHIVENVFNLGPVAEKPLSATLGVLLALDGDLRSMDMYNMFDISAALSEIEMVAGVSIRMLQENLFRFPLRDVLELNCWLSLFQTNNGTALSTDSEGFKIETLLSKFASLSVNADCLNCTSRVLSDVIGVVEAAGASEVFGNRLGFLVEDLATADIIPELLRQFIDLGDEAGRSCPHHPLFNTTSVSNSSYEFDLTDIPELSRMSIDTLLFTAIIFGEISVVIGADTHLQHPSEPTDPLAAQSALNVPDGAKLIDWTNLEDVGIPFISEILDLARSFLGDTEVTDSGEEVLGVNNLVSGFLDEDGVFELALGLSFEVAGVELTIHAVRAEGLNNFTEFDLLNPIAPQTFMNSLKLGKVKMGLDVSIDVLATAEPPNHLNVTFDIEDINVTVPVFAAVDEDKLGNLKLGSLLHISNLLPCALSTTYGIQLEQLLVSVGHISEPVFEGLLPDTNSAVTNSTNAIFEAYGTMIEESLPSVFDGTVRLMANGLLSSFEDSDCKEYSSETTSRYIDFRQMFQPGNASEFSPYGDIVPLIKDLLEEEFLSINPETQMPKINDVIISPFTEGQSGIEGTLSLPGKLFGFETDALGSLGVGNLGVSMFDARVENLDTVGHPLYFLEPNETRGDLLDNGANFGTQFNPLRFSIRGVLSLISPLIETRDEMDIFGELRSAPIFSVLLARIGAEEFLNFPLKHTSSVDCWLATLAAPALDELEAGNTTVNPIIGIHYLNIAFQNMRISAECFNCTTRGLDVVPDLLNILETTQTKNVLGHRNVDLILNLINSDFAQAWILRIFQDSLRKCEYTQNASTADLLVPNPDFPVISGYDMETGVFTVTVIIQLGLVILAETIAGIKGFIGPLFPDPEPEIPPGTRLVDFTALDTYAMGSLVQTVVDGLNSFLGDETVDEDTGEVSIGINEILGNPLLASVLPISVDQYSIDNELDLGISGLSVKMMGATVSGLDTFTRLNLFNFTGPTTMFNEVGWERLQIEVKLSVDLSGNPELNPTDIFGRKLEDDEEQIFDFTLTIELADVLAVADTFVALDYELLKHVQLGSFLRFDYILPCIQAAILHLEFTELDLSIGKVTKMQVSGFKSEDTKTAAENLEEKLLEKYGATIASMAPTVFSVALRPVVNTFITSYLRDSDFKCDEFPLDPATAGFVDFRDLLMEPEDSIEFGGSGRSQYGDMISTIYSYSNLVLNFVVFPLFDEGLKIPGALIDQGIRFDVRRFQSVIVLRVADLELTNVNSFGTLAYTDPIDGEPYMLNNSIPVGVRRNPLGIKFRVYAAFKGLGEELEEADIANDIEVTISISTLQLVLTALLKVREESFLKFPVSDMLDINCWLATIPPPELDEEGYKLPGQDPTLSLDTLRITMEEFNLGIKCLNCTSPDLATWNEILQTPGVSDDLTTELNALVKDLVHRFGGTFLQDQLDRLLVDAPKQCRHTDNYDPDAPDFKLSATPIDKSEDVGYLTYVLVIVTPLFVALVFFVVMRLLVNKRHKKWLQNLPSERVFLIQQKQEKEDHMEMELNELTVSMYESEEVSCIARYLVPLIVVINVGFFLSGHLSLGGRATLDINVAGESFRVDSFYEFSIAQSTLDMWHAGGEALAVLILLFSGIWPYTKQIITLALWFLPPSVVSVSRRGQFLLWLDLLAKWSMIDIFVLLITIAGFRIGGVSPDYSFLPKGLYDVQLIIVPMWGLYANMIAQVMSQISSHFIVMYHRRIIRTGKQKYMERHHPEAGKAGETAQQDPTELLIASLNADDDREQLCKYGFTRPHNEEGAKVVPRRVVNGLIPIIGIGLSALLVVCCIIPSMQLEAYGVVGILIEFGNKFAFEAVRQTSIFSKVKTLIDQAIYLGEWEHYIGNMIFVILFVTTLVIVPILTLGTLVYMWLYPLTRRARERVAVTLEILQAWQYVEVYILGIVIESWQLGAISKLFINRYCGDVDPVLEVIAGYGIIEPQDAQCFELAASIAPGAYLLIPFVVGLSLMGTYIVKAYIQYLREQHDKEDFISGDEKLRAFDRTTWDNRESALENIRNPNVLFTDTFKWTLAEEGPGTGVETLFALSSPDGDVDVNKGPAEMLPLADTSSSEGEPERVEHGSIGSAEMEIDTKPASQEILIPNETAEQNYTLHANESNDVSV